MRSFRGFTRLVVVLVFAVMFLTGICYGDLVAHWGFDEGSGSVASDSAGSHDGVVHGADWTNGKVGGGLEFNGSDDYVEVSDTPDLHFTQYDSFSFSFWAKPLSETKGFVIGKMRSNFGRGIFGYEVYYRSETSSFVFDLDCSYVQSIKTSTLDNSIVPGNWYHVTTVYDNKNASIYLNGQYCSSTYFSPNAGLTTPDKNLIIGARSYDNSILQHFHGQVDDVRVYNHALTQSEITALVPEPASILLISLGSLVVTRRKKNNLLF